MSHHGKHLIIDIWQAKNLDNIDIIRKALIDCAKICKATILDIKLHEFDKNKGITGVALLAESHISIHSWPESSYAAIDIFMCGNANPNLATKVLSEAFQTDNLTVQEINRG